MNGIFTYLNPKISDIWAQKNPQTTRPIWGLKFDTQTEGLGTFTIEINQMFVRIPYMDGMGYGSEMIEMVCGLY